jgi:hypothetical protein
MTGKLFLVFFTVKCAKQRKRRENVGVVYLTEEVMNFSFLVYWSFLMIFLHKSLLHKFKMSPVVILRRYVLILSLWATFVSCVYASKFW